MERKNTHAKKIKWASTNNVFFKTVAIKNNIKFSVKLNEIGGEDQLYFLKLNKLYLNMIHKHFYLRFYFAQISFQKNYII